MYTSIQHFGREGIHSSILICLLLTSTETDNKLVVGFVFLHVWNLGALPTAVFRQHHSSFRLKLSDLCYSNLLFQWPPQSSLSVGFVLYLGSPLPVRSYLSPLILTEPLRTPVRRQKTHCETLLPPFHLFPFFLPSFHLIFIE